ncbi:Reactive oxygen species modulator 1 [Sarcoptes scabiei]|nr:Reactive oxygen species modulator 1 [Sarcoptes scabiei]
MPPVSSVYGRHQAPSCFDRVKYGFMMGACVGLVSGGLFGGFRALRFYSNILMFYFSIRFSNLSIFFYSNAIISMGLRGRELLSSLTKVMIQGGGTFGTFMAIGTAIRC